MVHVTAEGEKPLPALSANRVLMTQIEMALRHHAQPELPTEFD